MLIRTPLVENSSYLYLGLEQSLVDIQQYTGGDANLLESSGYPAEG